MLSGLTSQLGGLMSRGQGQQGEGSGTGSPAPDADEEGNKKSRSGSTSAEATNNGEGAASVFSSVRSQLPSWLVGNKTTSNDTSQPETPAEQASNPEGTSTAGGGGEKEEKDKDSDASSATGGADSEKEQGPSDLDEAGGAAAGAGLEKVKTFGYQIFTTIKGAGQKIKDTNPLAEFQRQNDLFKASKAGGGAAVPPWVGFSKEKELKEEILSLSTDRRNFVRSPPTGVSFEWNYDEMLPIAKAILKEDPNLQKMRYDLVPKIISEENFWRNYFYRVTLIKESLSDESEKKKQDSIETDDEQDAELEKELNEELQSFEVVEGKVDTKELDTLLDLK